MCVHIDIYCIYKYMYMYIHKCINMHVHVCKSTGIHNCSLMESVDCMTSLVYDFIYVYVCPHECACTYVIILFIFTARQVFATHQ